MRNNKLSFLLVFVLLPFSVAAQNQDSVEGDRQALTDLYNATGGVNWNNNSGWLSGNPSNSWHGVEVDGQGRVVRLNLSENNLTGKLPSSIGNWTKLKYINLKQNALTGEIPFSIGNWTEIEWMQLSGRYAEDLNINPQSDYHPGKSDDSGNSFSGVFPDVWANFTKLKIFQLSGSQITIMFYESMSANTELLQIVASYNPQMVQELPSSWSTFTMIQKIYITQSGLIGTFPDPSNWTDIRFLNFSGDNELGGALPDFSNNTMLRALTLHRQNFTGEFPHYFNNGQFNNLINLGFSWNNLSGTLPEFNNLDLKIFTIDGNNLTGTIPESLTSNINLILLGLGWNNFTGQIPQTGWGDLNNLRYIQLQDNALTGSIPDELPNSSSLQRLEFQNNNLSGPLSVNHDKYADESNFPVFQHLRIDNNNFQPSDYEDLKLILGDKLRVGDQDPDNTKGEGSAPPPPSLQTPMDNSTGTSVTPSFSWSSVSADSYTLQVYTTDGTLVFENTGSGTSYSTPSNQALNYQSGYTWRVRASKGGLSGNWSTVWSFTSEEENTDETVAPAAPTLLTPEDNATGVSITPSFSWSSVNADSYTLQVYTTDGTLVFENTGSETGYSTPISRVFDYETTYNWRIRATRSTLTGEWSAVWSFTTGTADDNGGTGTVLPAPEVLSPSDGATNISLTPSLEWSNVDADYYILHLDSPTTDNLVVDAEVNGTSYTVTSSLNTDTLYKWRVRGVKNGIEGEWSPIAEFTTESKSSNGKGPNKVTPANDEKKVSKKTTFKWESTQEAEAYEIEVISTDDQQVVVDEIVADTTYTPGQDFQPNHRYDWRVRAIIDGEPEEWSDVWTFTTGEDVLATEVELEQNYPNPFNPSTNIRFALTSEQDVSLKVYDMTGRLVATLVNGARLGAGIHSASFDAQNLASGIYFYRIVTDREIITRKMTLMK